jgi:hypothetical protein
MPPVLYRNGERRCRMSRKAVSIGPSSDFKVSCVRADLRVEILSGFRITRRSNDLRRLETSRPLEIIRGRLEMA